MVGSSAPATPLAPAIATRARPPLQSVGDDGFIILSIAFVGGLVLLYFGFQRWQLSRLIEDTPTSTVRSMPVGRVELQGAARKHDAATTPPLADEECVHVDWHAEKREYRPDDDGPDHEWVTIGRGTHTYAFDLEDDTGSVLVRADRDDPDIDINEDAHSREEHFDSGESAPEDVRRFVAGDGNPESASLEDEESDGLLDSAAEFASDLATDSLDDTGNRRRYSETVLPVDSDAYVFGSAEPREGAGMEETQADLLQVGRDPESDTFLISDSSESALAESYGKWGPAMIVGGLALSAGALFLLLSEYQVHEALL